MNNRLLLPSVGAGFYFAAPATASSTVAAALLPRVGVSSSVMSRPSSPAALQQGGRWGGVEVLAAGPSPL